VDTFNGKKSKKTYSILKFRDPPPKRGVFDPPPGPPLFEQRTAILYAPYYSETLDPRNTLPETSKTPFLDPPGTPPLDFDPPKTHFFPLGFPLGNRVLKSCKGRMPKNGVSLGPTHPPPLQNLKKHPPFGPFPDPPLDPKASSICTPRTSLGILGILDILESSRHCKYVPFYM
jgi:hypothetical protein